MLSLLFNRVAPRAILLTSNANVLRRVVVVPLAGIQPASRTFLTSVQLASPAAAAKTESAKTTKGSSTSKGTKKSTSTTKRTASRSSDKPAKKPLKKAAKAPKPTPAELAKKLKFAPEELPPKRPMSSFIRFGQTLQLEHGSSLETVQMRSRKAGELWKQMSAAEKQPYQEQARQAFEQYYKDKEEYFKKVDPSVLRKINSQRKARGKLMIKRPAGSSAKPLSPYMRYVVDGGDSFDHNAPAGTTGRNLMIWRATEAGRRWRALSDQEKQPYIEGYRKDMEEYNKAHA